MASPILASLALLYGAGVIFVVRCVRQAPRGHESDAGFELEPEELEGKKLKANVGKRRFWRRERAKEPSANPGEAAISGELSSQPAKNPATRSPK